MLICDKAIAPQSSINRRVRAYWDSLAKDGLPARRDIEPADIPALLPHIYLVEVSYEPLDFQYRLIGTAIVERSARDYTGTSIRDIPMQAPPSQIWSLYETVATTGQPTCTLIPYRDEKDRFVEKQCLPLSSDGTTIDMLLGSIVFEEERVRFPERNAL
ncbi:PAS domain-containing protein [Aestuariispira insulae]|uniref:PAS domain-containing protein n=1 Tax=Aestuariispira insulae TaxID=1461337 RepID=A0A3D9H6K5_9PROT|nr:PAS domain-containing protein [Aestuariispira insulae]RED45130.1 PAS domain-containing protein [Aestuariispira insulae]